MVKEAPRGFISDAQKEKARRPLRVERAGVGNDAANLFSLSAPHPSTEQGLPVRTVVMCDISRRTLRSSGLSLTGRSGYGLTLHRCGSTTLLGYSGFPGSTPDHWSTRCAPCEAASPVFFEGLCPSPC
jgi:hypothetical protein